MALPISLHWFRQDLRLADNPALTAAAQAGAPQRPAAGCASRSCRHAAGPMVPSAAARVTVSPPLLKPRKPEEATWTTAPPKSLAMLLAGKPWRIPLSADETRAEEEREMRELVFEHWVAAQELARESHTALPSVWSVGRPIVKSENTFT